MADVSRRASRAARSLASLALLAALVTAVPFGLARASAARFGSANPLAGVAPPWRWHGDTFRRALARPLDDGTVTDSIVRAGLVTVWVALAIVLLTTVAETVHLVRHRGFTLPDVRGLGWAQRIGRFIAAGLIVIGPLTSVRTSVAAPDLAVVVPAVTALVETAIVEPMPSFRTAIADPGEGPLPVVGAAQPAAAWADERGAGEGAPDRDQLDDAQTREHVVVRGESVYSIAGALAGGDPVRTVEIADAILDANLGTVMPGGQRFTNPAYIEPGWILVVPSPGGVDPPAPEAVAPTDPPRPERLHLVVAGDTLSAIAAEHLGDPNAWPLVWAANAGRVMDDGRTFDDPNLILPGWRIAVPAATTAGPSATADERSPAESPQEALPPIPAPTVSAGPESSTPTTSPAPSTATPTTSPAPSTSTAGPTTAARTTTTGTTTTTGVASEAGSADTDEGAEATRGAPSPLRIEHAAVLAAGVLALVGIRRRVRLRASRPRSRVPEPRSDVAATERRLRTIDPGERAARVDVAIRAAAAELARGDARIGLVAVGRDGDIELRLTADGEPGDPWSGSGASWRLAATVPIEMLTEAARRVGAPCVALAQLGVTPDGADVLVDLEAAGLLSIESDPQIADQIVTALAAGLGGSLYAEVAHLVTVSLPAAATLEHRNAHHADSVDAALELATDLAGSTLAHNETTFVLRCHQTGGEVWEPVVVLLGSADVRGDDAGALTAPTAGHGLAIVAANGPGTSTATHRLVACAAGWVLEAFGCATEIRPVGLPPEDLAEVTRLLDDATRPLVDERADRTDGDQGEAAADVEFVPADHDIVVSLMGPVEVTDRAGNRASFERSKTVELIAWLATHREHSTRQAARTALWELDVRDATFANVVSEARRGLARLVSPPEGVEWLERTLSEQLPLHPGVVTDAQLIEARLRAATMQPPAQAIDTLRPAVELIRDVPFAGTSYLWPDAEGLTSNLVLLTTSVTAELAGHGLSTGDIELVFWATARGLKVLPGHEELIGLRMRAHAKAGDLAGVRQEWEAYERVIVADAWSDGEPAPKLLELRRQLLSTPR
jgi:nucleoid-associated protein YgaU